MLVALDDFISINSKRNGDTVRILLAKALPIATRLKDEQFLSRLLMQKGMQYQNQNKYLEAVNTYHEAAAYKISNNVAGEVYMLTLFSAAFLGMNNKDSAGWYAHAAVDSAKRYQLKMELADAYQALYKYHHHFGEYKRAFEDKLLLDSINQQMANAAIRSNHYAGSDEI